MEEKERRIFLMANNVWSLGFFGGVTSKRAIIEEIKMSGETWKKVSAYLRDKGMMKISSVKGTGKWAGTKFVFVSPEEWKA